MSKIYYKYVPLESTVSQAENLFVVIAMSSQSTDRILIDHDEKLHIEFKRYRLIEVLKNITSYTSSNRQPHEYDW